MKAIVAIALVCMLGAVRASPPILWQVMNETQVGYSVYANTPPYNAGNGFAYVGGNNGWVYAQNISSGWLPTNVASRQINLNYSTSSVNVLFNISGNLGVLQNEYVYCLGLDFSVKWVWKGNYSAASYYTSDWYTFSPVVANGMVYVGEAGYGYVYAINAMTGATAWKSPQLSAGSYTNKQMAFCPIRNALFVPTGNNVYALDALTGAALWYTPSQGNTISTVGYDTNSALLFAGTTYGYYYVFNASNNGTKVGSTISQGSGNCYVQPFTIGTTVYMFMGSYLITYDTRFNNYTISSSFTVNGYSGAVLKYWAWGDNTLYVQADASYRSGLFTVTPQATYTAVYYNSDYYSYGITYANGYILFSSSYTYLVVANQGYQGTNNLWVSAYSNPFAAIWSPVNNGTIVIANSYSTKFLIGMPFNPSSASGTGTRYSTQYSISSINIAVNGTNAYTCDYYYTCYNVNGSTGNGTQKSVSSYSMSSSGGVALTYNNLFSTRSTYMAVLDTTTMTTTTASGSNGVSMSYSASYVPQVGSDGNVYSTNSYNTVMFNGITGTIMLQDSNTPRNQGLFALNYLYIVSGSTLYAYNTKVASLTAQPTWKATNTHTYSLYSSPVQYGGQVYVGDYYGNTNCYGRESGVQIWTKRQSSSTDQVYFIIPFGTNVMSFTSTFFTAYDMSSGVPQYTTTFRGSFQWKPVLTPDGTLIVYTDGVYVLNLNSKPYPTSMYNGTMGFSPSSSYPPVFINGALYWPTSSNTIVVTNAYTGAVLFIIADQNSISAESLTVGWNNQTLWYGASSYINAAPIAIASKYVTARPASGYSPNNTDKTEEKSKLWIIAVVVGIILVIVIIVVVKSKSGGGGDGQKDNNYVSMQQPVNSGV